MLQEMLDEMLPADSLAASRVMIDWTPPSGLPKNEETMVELFKIIRSNSSLEGRTVSFQTLDSAARKYGPVYREQERKKSEAVNSVLDEWFAQTKKDWPADLEQSQETATAVLELLLEQNWPLAVQNLNNALANLRVRKVLAQPVAQEFVALAKAKFPELLEANGQIGYNNWFALLMVCFNEPSFRHYDPATKALKPNVTVKNLEVALILADKQGQVIWPKARPTKAEMDTRRTQQERESKSVEGTNARIREEKFSAAEKEASQRLDKWATQATASERQWLKQVIERHKSLGYGPLQSLMEASAYSYVQAQLESPRGATHGQRDTMRQKIAAIVKEEDGGSVQSQASAWKRIATRVQALVEKEHGSPIR